MSNVRHTSLRLRVSTDAEGVLEGSSATFGVAYGIGQRQTETLRDGCFNESIQESGGMVPVFWSHGWRKGNETPIGHAVVREDDGRLKTVATLYIDTDPRARSVFEAAKAGALREWSVGFLTPNEGDIKVRGNNEEIVRGTLLEVSVVMKGAGITDMVSVREDESGEVVEDDPVIVSMREKYNDEQRAEHVSSGNALPDGSYAIADADDLTDAIYEHAQSGFYGSGGTAARAHIVARADSLGLTDRLPSAWRTREDESEAVELDAEVRERAIARLGNSAIRRALNI